MIRSIKTWLKLQDLKTKTNRNNFKKFRYKNKRKFKKKFKVEKLKKIENKKCKIKKNIDHLQIEKKQKKECLIQILMTLLMKRN